MIDLSSLHTGVSPLPASSSSLSFLPSPLPAQFSVVWVLLGVLRGHVTTAKADLLSSSLTAPMYGVLQAIRAAMETVSIR